MLVSPTGQGVTVPAGSETNADILDNEFPECGQNRPGHNANAVNVFGVVGAETKGTVNAGLRIGPDRDRRELQLVGLGERSIGSRPRKR